VKEDNKIYHFATKARFALIFSLVAGAFRLFVEPFFSVSPTQTLLERAFSFPAQTSDNFPQIFTNKSRRCLHVLLFMTFQCVP